MRVPIIITAFALLLMAQPSIADSTTYVSSCGVSSSSDYETLLVTSDIEGTGCILVTHQHVTVDCQGHLLSGPYPDNGLGQGIRIEDTGDYATVRNCRLAGFFVPIYLLADDGLIEHNEALDGGFGIALGDSYNSVVRKNVLHRNSWTAIHVIFSDGNLIADNMVKDSGAIIIEQSHFNDVINNRCSEGGAGISVAESNWNNIVGNKTKMNAFAGIFLMDAQENFVAENKAYMNDVGIYESGDDLNNVYEDNVCKNNTTDSNVPYACD